MDMKPAHPSGVVAICGFRRRRGGRRSCVDDTRRAGTGSRRVHRRSPHRERAGGTRDRTAGDGRGDCGVGHGRRAGWRGLPPGRGTAAEGAPIYAARCAGCHGKTGKEGPNDVLVGRLPGDAFTFAREARTPKTIGSYWPYTTTAFDYIRRAMPPDKPGSLRDEEVYGLVAYLLSLNELVRADAVDRRGIAAEGEDAGARTLRSGHAWTGGSAP